jgi:hypothetical protein
MRRTILALWLAGVMAPAAARAEAPDGGPPDGTAISTPRALAQNDTGAHTGGSNDPNGNLGNTGRTGRPDGGDHEQSGPEGNTGARAGNSRPSQPDPSAPAPAPKSPVTP